MSTNKGGTSDSIEATIRRSKKDKAQANEKCAMKGAQYEVDGKKGERAGTQ